MTKIVDVYVYLRTNFQVFRIILPTFRQGGGEFTPPPPPTSKPTPKKPTQIRVKGFQIGIKRLQIGATVSNRSKEILNRGRDYKSGQDILKTGPGITNRCRT